MTPHRRPDHHLNPDCGLIAPDFLFALLAHRCRGDVPSSNKGAPGNWDRPGWVVQQWPLSISVGGLHSLWGRVARPGRSDGRGESRPDPTTPFVPQGARAPPGTFLVGLKTVANQPRHSNRAARQGIAERFSARRASRLTARHWRNHQQFVVLLECSFQVASQRAKMRS